MGRFHHGCRVSSPLLPPTSSKVTIVYPSVQTIWGAASVRVGGLVGSCCPAPLAHRARIPGKAPRVVGRPGPAGAASRGKPDQNARAGPCLPPRVRVPPLHRRSRDGAPSPRPTPVIARPPAALRRSRLPPAGSRAGNPGLVNGAPWSGGNRSVPRPRAGAGAATPHDTARVRDPAPDSPDRLPPARPATRDPTPAGRRREVSAALQTGGTGAIVSPPTRDGASGWPAAGGRRRGGERARPAPSAAATGPRASEGPCRLGAAPRPSAGGRHQTGGGGRLVEPPPARQRLGPGPQPGQRGSTARSPATGPAVGYAAGGSGSSRPRVCATDLGHCCVRPSRDRPRPSAGPPRRERLCRLRLGPRCATPGSAPLRAPCSPASSAPAGPPSPRPWQAGAFPTARCQDPWGVARPTCGRRGRVIGASSRTPSQTFLMPWSTFGGTV